MSEATAPPLYELPRVAQYLAEAASAVQEMTVEYEEDVVANRSMRERRQLADDLEGRIVYLRRQLEKIEAFMTKEKTRNGWD